MFPTLLFSTLLSQNVFDMCQKARVEMLVTETKKLLDSVDRSLAESKRVGQETQRLLRQLEIENEETDDFLKRLDKLIERNEPKSPPKK
jgi:hypothetical protein